MPLATFKQRIRSKSNIIFVRNKDERKKLQVAFVGEEPPVYTQ